MRYEVTFSFGSTLFNSILLQAHFYIFLHHASHLHHHHFHYSSAVFNFRWHSLFDELNSNNYNTGMETWRLEEEDLQSLINWVDEVLH